MIELLFDGNVPDMTLLQIYFYQQKIKDGHHSDHTRTCQHSLI